MAGVDKVDLTSNESDIDAVLFNGAGVGSITPDAHNQLLEDALKSSAFFRGMKFVIKQSGTPSAGEISLDGDDFDTATVLQISKTDDHAKDTSTALGLISNGSVIQLKDYAGNFGEFLVTSITDSGTYYSIDVTASGSNPSYAPTGLEGFVSVYAVGGSDTDTNGVGNYEMAGSSGIIPGPDGTFNFDNATVASATVIRITDLDNDTANKGQLLNLIPEGSFLYLQQRDNRKNYAIIEVGSVTDNGSYVAYGINSITEYGSLSVGEEFFLIPLSYNNILNSDNTMLSNHTQTLGGNLLRFQTGLLGFSAITFSTNGGSISYNGTPVSTVIAPLGNTSTALDVDLSQGNSFSATATDNFTISFSNAPSADLEGIILITQDGVGSRVMSAGSNVFSPGGVMPLLTSVTPNSVDIVKFIYYSGLNKMVITEVIQDIQ